MAEDLRFTKVIASGPFVTGPERDYTVKVDAGGLRPGHRYWYRFIADGVTSPTGRTRTLPIGSVEQFRVGVCSCSNYPQGYFNVYRDMAVADLDLVLHLGDYIYEYGEGVYANPMRWQPWVVGWCPSMKFWLWRIIVSATVCTVPTRTCKLPMPPIPGSAFGMIMNWPTTPGIRELENHNEGEGDFAARIAAARRVYHEWMPIRSSPESDQGPIYRSFQVGDLAELIMLDTRLVGRDRQLDYRRDLLGPGIAPSISKNRFWPTRIGPAGRAAVPVAGGSAGRGQG